MLLKCFIFIIAAAVSMLACATVAVAININNIAVSEVEPASVVLVVKTDADSDVTVEYGISPGVYTATRHSNGLKRHEVTLDNLTPSTVVYYRVDIISSGNPADAVMLAENNFSTARLPGDPFSYGVAGDNRPDTDSVTQPAVWSTIIGQMVAENLDLVLNVGDIIYGVGSDTLAQNVARYDGFFAVTTQITATAPLYISVGNHERINAANSRSGYEQEFTLPTNNGTDAGTYGEEYFSFDNGDTHFISLCTEIPGQEGLITGNQKTWLVGDLAATDRIWIVVFMHRPLFSGLHAWDPWVNPGNAAGQQNKAEIHALFQQYDVDMVFQGHEHHYLHHEEDEIHYLISGGGGASLSLPALLDPGDIFGASAFHHLKVDETTSSMTVTANQSNGLVLESFRLWALDLNLSSWDTYWTSYADYSSGNLTVEYLLSNNDKTGLSNIQVVDLEATNGVNPITGTPFAIPDLNEGQSTTFIVKYIVPTGVSSFHALSYITCSDDNGNSYEFPGPAPEG